VEIPAVRGAPTRAGAKDLAGCGGRYAIHEPQRLAAIRVLPQEVVKAFAARVLGLVGREEEAERHGGVDPHLAIERRPGDLASLLEIGGEALHAAVRVVRDFVHHETARELIAAAAIAGEVES